MEEKSQASKWLLGCGIGCGVIILIGIIIAVSTFFICRNTVMSFKEVENTRDELQERYGQIEDFTPKPNASIDAERIEIFLSVRDSMQSSIRELDTTLTTLESLDDDTTKSFWGVLGGIRKGFGMIPNIAGFYLSRNRALLSLDMSPGEYYYLYVLAFYSYLDKSPDDGPGDEVMRTRGGFTIYDSDEDEEESDETWKKEMRGDQNLAMVKRIRWKMIPLMENQLNEIDKNAASYSRVWRNALETEISKLKDDRDRIPWQDRLPRQLKASFEPFRDRLEQSYNPITNIFELMQEQDWED